MSDVKEGPTQEAVPEGKEAATAEDLQKALSLLDDEKKASAGKDKKITSYMQEKKELEAKLAQVTAERDGVTAGMLDKLTKQAALAGELQSLEKQTRARAAAVEQAVKTGIPVSLAVANADRLPELEKELSALAESIRAGLEDVSKRAVAMEAVNRRNNPRMGSRSANEIKADMLKGKSALDLARIRRMAPDEISRIPAHILDRLGGLNDA